MGAAKGENLGPRLLAISIIIVTVAALFTSLRFYARYLKGKIYWWDDWTVLVALACTFSPTYSALRKLTTAGSRSFSPVVLLTEHKYDMDSVDMSTRFRRMTQTWS